MTTPTVYNIAAPGHDPFKLWWDQRSQRWRIALSATSVITLTDDQLADTFRGRLDLGSVDHPVRPRRPGETIADYHDDVLMPASVPKRR